MPDATNLAYKKFCERYDSLLSGMARMGWTSSEAIHRASVLYPDIDRDLLKEAVHSGRWLFGNGQGQTHSNVLMASAIWYAVAVTYEFEPDYEYAAVDLDPTIVQDLPRMLETFAVPAETIAAIVGRIGAALKYVAEHPYTELEEQTYDDLLAHLPQEIAHISRGNFSWPPSRALIEDRLGDRSWAKALLKVGICPPKAEGQDVNLEASSLSERTFRNTLGEFLNYCIRYDRKPSVLLYGTWAEDPAQNGRVPHLGAVRAKYGSWHLALQAGRQMLNEALALGGSPALPVSSVIQVPADPTEPLNIEDIQAQGIGVVQPKTPTDSERSAQAWQELVSVMEQRLEELPWSLSLHLYYISPDVVATGDYTNYVSILRSPAGYFCELTAPEEFESVEVQLNADFLKDAGWTAPAAAGRWTRNFLSLKDAAQGIIEAMREGMGCDQSDYFQSDDPTGSPAINIADPNTGSIPMVPVTGKGYVAIEDFN